MPRCAPLFALAVAVLAVAFARADPAGARERWRRPLPGGAVARAFVFERSAPYQRGRRRGVDFSGRPGAGVVAACGGVVSYAGRLPGRRAGRGVTIRCGGLVATELGLSATSVRRGERVGAGTPIGTLGAGPLRLGARVATDRHGYRDPLMLMGDDHAPVAPPPLAARRRSRGRIAPRAVPKAAPSAASAQAALPLPALAGAALVALGAGGGTALRARRARRRRRGAEAVAPQAS